MKAKEIAEYIGGILVGDGEREVSQAVHIEDANSSDLAYCERRNPQREFHAITNSKAGVIICSNKIIDLTETFGEWLYCCCTECSCDKPRATLILSEHPRYDFGKVVEQFFYVEKQPPIHGSVVILDGVELGRNVVVAANAILGAEGMNYARNKMNVLQRIPHLGKLKIGDNVYVGASSIVQKGTLKDTVIGDGSKIGPNCIVGHGCQLGANCLVTGMVFLGGSVKLGDNVYVGAHSTVKNGVKIGEGAFIGIGSLVLTDVPAGDIVVGRPAVDFEKFKEERKQLKKILQS